MRVAEVNEQPFSGEVRASDGIAVGIGEGQHAGVQRATFFSRWRPRLRPQREHGRHRKCERLDSPVH
jgi:hypothetical protein